MPPPPYEETDPDEHLPLAVLLLSARQKRFVPAHFVLLAGARMQIAAQDKRVASRSRLATELRKCRGQVREVSFLESCAADVLLPTHIAVFDGSDHELSHFYRKWTDKMRFPSENCFIAVVRRTAGLKNGACVVVELDNDLVFYYKPPMFS